MPTYSFTIRATDNLGAFADRAFTIDVTNSNVENFIIPSNGSTVMTSKDGITWTNRATSSTFRSVAWGNNKWVAVTSTSLATSSDGINWSYVTHATAFASLAARTPRTVHFGNGVFCVGTENSTSLSNYVYYSTDAVTWTRSLSTITANSGVINMFANNGSRWVLQDTGASNTGVLWLSDDNGVTWSSISKHVSGNWSGGKYAAGLWCFLHDSTGSWYVSYDNLASFVTASTAWGTMTQPSMAYGNGIWVGGSGSGSGNKIGRTLDTLTFGDFVTSAMTEQIGFGFAAGRFVYARSSTTSAAYSSDGITWTAVTLPASFQNNSPSIFQHLIGCRT